MKRIRIILLLLLAAVLLAGCGKKTDPGAKPESTPTPLIVEEVPSPTPTPTPEPTATPTPTPLPMATTTPTSPPAATPTPTPTPAAANPAATSNLPIVTKNPTNESVAPGGSCSFSAEYQNAIYAVWHFVSPDGATDLTYEMIGTKFPNLQVSNGMYSTMTLSNIPEAMNGWRVYCCYSNDYGSTSTEKASITVTTGQGSTSAGSTAGGTTAANTVSYEGLYVEEDDDGCTMEISADSGTYYVTVTKFEDSEHIIMWEFSGKFNGDRILYYDEGVKTTLKYDEQGNEEKDIDPYDHSGDLDYWPSKNGIYWTDDDEEYDIDDIFFSAA
ncbi:MAG: hypothetical protein IKS55_12325 [Oscillospiraceae bacterium]|nr:hypothetical protein [Oscillospiraceae bacterium]